MILAHPPCHRLIIYRYYMLVIIVIFCYKITIIYNPYLHFYNITLLLIDFWMLNKN